MNYCPLRFFDLKINNNIDKKSHWPTIDFAWFLGSCKNKNEESKSLFRISLFDDVIMFEAASGLGARTKSISD